MAAAELPKSCHKIAVAKRLAFGFVSNVKKFAASYFISHKTKTLALPHHQTVSVIDLIPPEFSLLGELGVISLDLCATDILWQAFHPLGSV
mgnify:CR=1 FL=1